MFDVARLLYRLAPAEVHLDVSAPIGHWVPGMLRSPSEMACSCLRSQSFQVCRQVERTRREGQARPLPRVRHQIGHWAPGGGPWPAPATDLNFAWIGLLTCIVPW